MRRSTAGTLLVLGAAAGFGTIGIFGKLAVEVDLPLRTLLPFRFALATAVVLGLAAVGRWELPARRREWAVTLGLGLVYTEMTLAFFTSLRSLPAGLATILLYTYPAFVVVLAALALDESVTRWTLVALACALAGVALVVGVDTAGVAPTGVGFAVLAAGGYAVYTAGSRAVVSAGSGDGASAGRDGGGASDGRDGGGAPLSPRALMAGALVGTTLAMVVYGLVAGGVGLPAGGRQWGIVLGLAVVGTVLPLVLFYEGVERLAASRVGVVSTAEPVVTVALGALVLGEPVTPAIVVGGVLVLGGVALVQRTRTRGRPPADASTAGE